MYPFYNSVYDSVLKLFEFRKAFKVLAHVEKYGLVGLEYSECFVFGMQRSFLRGHLCLVCFCQNNLCALM